MTVRKRIAAALVLLAIGLAGAPLGAGWLPADLFAQTAHPTGHHVDVLDPHNLPLGDGRVSIGPKRGFVYACQQQFRGGSASVTAPWIHGDHWDLTQKLAVSGAVKWPDAQFKISRDGSQRLITGNDLPVDHATGRFPIAQDDPAWQVDRNPNAIRAQSLSLALPADPQSAAQPSCLPMGMIGVAMSGVAFFNALDDAGRDAVAHEVQDACSGHPQMQGMYHYHGPSRCLPGETADATLVGYALDGFGIYSEYDATGREITNADLDDCHGRTDSVMWDGRPTEIYHYVLTREYPYTLGCFKGQAVRMPPGSRPPPGGFDGLGQPPPRP